MGFASGYNSFDRGTERGQALKRRYGKPAKTVFNTDEVAHIWAQQNQSWGRNGKASVYFERETIYSYGEHFPMARFTTDKRGRTVVLYNSAHYSSQTSQHQGAAWSAVKDETPKFKVRHCRAATESEHAGNFAGLVAEFVTSEQAARNRKGGKWSREHAVNRLAAQFVTMGAYRAAFLNGNKYRMPQMPRDLDALRSEIVYDDHAKELRETQRLLERKVSRLRGHDRGKPSRLYDLSRQYRALVRDASAMARVARAYPNVGVVPVVDYRHALKMWHAIRPKLRFVGERDLWHGHHSGFTGHAWREREANEVRDKAVAHPAELVERMRAMVQGSDTYFSDWWAEKSIEELRRLPAHCAEYRIDCPVSQAEIEATCEAVQSRIDTHKAAEQRKHEAEQAEQFACTIREAEDAKLRKLALNGDEAALEHFAQRWRDGDNLEYRLRDQLPTMLRKADDDTVETSMGARFPVSHCKPAWRIIKRCVSKGETFETNGRTIHLGPYQIDRIAATGEIVAGCHRIAYEEARKLAISIGLEE